MSEIKKAFDSFDLDQSGSIKVNQLRDCLRKSNFDTNNEFFYQFIYDLENDSYVVKNNGYVDFDDLVNYLADKYANYYTKDGLRNIFDLYVDDKRSCVSYNQFKKLTEELGYFFDDVTVRGLFQRISKNGKEISFNEFEDIMSNF